MSNFPEPSTPGFVPVYQLKRTDAVDAGAAGDGPSNLPLKNLVERTAYLKKEVEDLDTAFGGVVIGSTVQAYDDDLAAIAALTTTGLIDRTGAGTAATRKTGATGLAVLAAADASAARTAISAPPVDGPSFTGIVQTTGNFFSSGVTDGVAQSILKLDVAGTTAHDRHGFFRQYTSGVGTAAAIILSNTVSRAYNGGLALVRGRLSSDHQGVVFLDLVLHRATGVTVIQSSTVIGSPASRTYSVIGSGNRELTLAMASGTYNIEVIYQA